MSNNYKVLLFMFFELIFFLIALILGIAILLKEDLLKTINLDFETNDYCQRIDSLSDNKLDRYACENKFKKEKIIFLLIDSLPYDVLLNLRQFNKSKISNFFRGQGIEYKQSGALFETILNGKFSRNYLASNEMKMDNLQKQFINAKIDAFYKVQDFPIYGLLNKSLINQKLFEKHKGEESPLYLFCDIDVGPPSQFGKEVSDNYNDETGYYFKEGLNQEILYSKANEKLDTHFKKMKSQFNKCLKSKNFSSYIFYSDTLDHINHCTQRKSPRATYAVYFIEKIVQELIEWINEEHPEYALALVSDHGGQTYYGEDTLCNHGCNHLGNEAVFFVYTKELGENYDKYHIKYENGEAPIVSLNDFVCVFASVLKDFNYPLETTCTPRYIGNDKLIYFSSIKLKEFQLKQYVEKLARKYQNLREEYTNKYESRLKSNKFNEYFKDLNSIYTADESFYEEYKDYLMNIQNELLQDVVKSGQNLLYFTTFYIILALFIFGLLYHLRRLIIITREKIFKEIKRNEEKNNPFLTKLGKYAYIIELILLIEPIICIIYNNSLNISYYISLSVWFKFFALFFLIISVMFFHKINKQNYKKLLFNIAFILILHLIGTNVKFFTSLDKYFFTQKRVDFLKIYLTYPLLLIYGFIEFYSQRNSYFIFTKKCKIRYLYIIIPYLLLLSYYILSFDFYLNINNPMHSPHDILILRIIYWMTFFILLFIKPFEYKKEENNLPKNVLIGENKSRLISSDIINIKLFFFVMIIFICIELERVEMILFFNFILFYLCYCYKNEKDIFIKMIYIILIISYPEIHFIANQGTYTMDTSIKVTLKCPSKWADDRPIVMGLIFIVDKFRFNFMNIGYVFSLIKISKKKLNYFYTEFMTLIMSIQSFGFLLCFLYYVKMEKAGSYIQILYLIATQLVLVITFNLFFLINYIIHKIVNSCIEETPSVNYEPINLDLKLSNSLINDNYTDNSKYIRLMK